MEGSDERAQCKADGRATHSVLVLLADDVPSTISRSSWISGAEKSPSTSVAFTVVPAVLETTARPLLVS